MAITKVVKEKESATLNSDSVPYMVQEDPDSVIVLTKSAAVTAALAQALIDQGTAATDYNYRRISNKSARVVVKYRPLRFSPLTPPSLGFGAGRF